MKGPIIKPWGTTPGFAEFFCRKGLEYSDQDGDLDDIIRWECEKCGGVWKTTGITEWEYREWEHNRNIGEKRRFQQCKSCYGIIWEPHPEKTDFSPPSPTGVKCFDNKRWVFEGLGLKAWEFYQNAEKKP